MVKLYVVDRYNRYRENHIVSLKTSKDITPIELSHLAMALFPDSVSDQGNYYFLSNSPYVNPTINIDWSFEFYRRARHPDKPSREGANKQVISSQADSLIKISRIWADFFPANTSNQPI